MTRFMSDPSPMTPLKFLSVEIPMTPLSTFHVLMGLLASCGGTSHESDVTHESPIANDALEIHEYSESGDALEHLPGPDGLAGLLHGTSHECA